MKRTDSRSSFSDLVRSEYERMYSLGDNSDYDSEPYYKEYRDIRRDVL